MASPTRSFLKGSLSSRRSSLLSDPTSSSHSEAIPSDFSLTRGAGARQREPSIIQALVIFEVQSSKAMPSVEEQRLFLHTIQQLYYASIHSSISFAQTSHGRLNSRDSLRYGVLLSTSCSTLGELNERLGSLGLSLPLEHLRLAGRIRPHRSSPAISSTSGLTCFAWALLAMLLSRLCYARLPIATSRRFEVSCSAASLSASRTVCLTVRFWSGFSTYLVSSSFATTRW